MQVRRCGVFGSVCRGTVGAALLVIAASYAARGADVANPSLTREQKARAEALKFENMDKMVSRIGEYSPMRWISRGGNWQPLDREERQVGQIHYEFGGQSYTVDEMFTRLITTGMVVLHNGKLVYERYRPGANEGTHFWSFSAGKSITSTLVGLALADGSIASVHDQLTKYIPELKGTAYEGVTLKNVLQMSSGVRWQENYVSPQSDIAQLGLHVMVLKDVSANEFAKTLQREAPPGTVFNYSTSETQLIAWAVKQATGKNPADYLSEKIWSRIGMEHDAGWIVDVSGMEGGGGGILATVRDYARFGQLMLQDGVWNGERILAKGWVQEATTPDAPQVQYGKLPWGEPEGYQYQWFAVAGPDRAFCAEGVHGQMIYVNPAKKLVVARMSAWPEAWNQQYKREAWTAFEEIGRQLERPH
jgi:CubicO group peptidase (beta-lactamase class C family)